MGYITGPLFCRISSINAYIGLLCMVCGFLADPTKYADFAGGSLFLRKNVKI